MTQPPPGVSPRVARIASLIRDIPEFPEPGVLFRDITPVLSSAAGFQDVISELLETAPERIDIVAGIEARGFMFAAPLAVAMDVGFVPIRKPGKLPAATFEQSYELEYGYSSLQIHQDAIRPGQRVLVIDDLLASGGTMVAAVDLVRQTGGEVAQVSTVIELEGFDGREKLESANVPSIKSILKL
jgi:adenine phosphoribosyltransferase